MRKKRQKKQTHLETECSLHVSFEITQITSYYFCPCPTAVVDLARSNYPSARSLSETLVSTGTKDECDFTKPLPSYTFSLNFLIIFTEELRTHS